MGTFGAPGIAVVTCTGLFFEVNVLYNYWHAICLDGGRPPPYEEVGDQLEEDGKPKFRKCAKCTSAKPERAHHCSVCRRCILKMDHHCPWVNNCVGHGNYRYFCLFMLFLTFGCTYLLVVFYYNLDDVVMYRRRRRGTRESRQCIATCFTMCGSVLMALCGLGGFHLYLVLTNQTTIEFQTNILRRRQARKNGEYFRNQYDLGRSRNFQQVFGPNPFWKFLWLFPYLNVPPSGDGVEYPSLRAPRMA